jgi:hypothetical protein
VVTCKTGLLFVSETPEGGTPLVDDNPVYLPDPILDAAVRMLVELSAQLWIERERRWVTEQLLESRGLLTSHDIESFKPDPSQFADLKAERARFIEDVFKELRHIPIKSTPHTGGGKS